MKRAEKYMCLLAVLLFAVAGCSTGLKGDGAATGPLEPNIDGATGVTATAGAVGGGADEAVVYPLTVNIVGNGTVSFGTTVFSNPSTTMTLAENATVDLAMAPGTGYEFAGWSGSACSGLGSCKFLMNGEKLVTANFRESATSIDSSEKTLNIKLKGPADAADAVLGMVQSVGGGSINCASDCQKILLPVDASPISVDLTATANPLFAFTGWTGACAGLDLCNVMLADEVTEVTANFDYVKIIRGMLGAGSEPGKMKVFAKTFAGELPQVTYPISFVDTRPANATVTMVPVPVAGTFFAAWTAGPCATPDKANIAACTFTLSDNVTVEVVFKKVVADISGAPPAADIKDKLPANAPVPSGMNMNKPINTNIAEPLIKNTMPTR